jgi:hypothetical protein
MLWQPRRRLHLPVIDSDGLPPHHHPSLSFPSKDLQQEARRQLQSRLQADVGKRRELRRDLLVATGKLDSLVQALARFSTRLRVVEAAKDERFVAREARTWGPALVFGRLWERQGLPEILSHRAGGRRAPDRTCGFP